VTPPSWLQSTRAISRVTFFEIIRDKVLYNIVFFALMILGMGFLAAQMTYAHPERIIVDFGIAALSISCAVIAALTGSSLLNREFERRTAYVALSHPISRGQFLLGKYAGLAWVLAVNWLLLVSAFLFILNFTADNFYEILTPILGWALVFALLQGLVLASITLFFSTFCTSSLTFMFTVGIYLIGNNISEIRLLAAHSKAPALNTALNSLSSILPNLEHFNLGSSVTYGLPPSPGLISAGLFYGCIVSVIFLFLAGLLIRTKEV